ncbi:MAG: hypothetical protein UW86_C0003G0003 [Microgenomates group bacterium GW2011_GWA1_Microgenomates_45_10]|nr:MAG: hypothetical protein UW69_C0027G0003 [Microgenomates group bacterium GW2011_GWA2_44_7]KKT77635.1 MAG: hypothetical protein UW73_C0015G0003 [Microgenomates group bacterium GW2011_GWB1_44_8]KKT87358.1 MAG: hypothetical protein UW86_C0003G0003 [Microgenomates group bacterium GW2011_GWA1_Microgenomates_45_10]
MLSNRDLLSQSEAERLQQSFEELIRAFKESGQESTLDQGAIGGLRQEFFVRGSYDHDVPPETGAAMTSSGGGAARMEFRLAFFIGQPSEYGKMMIAENRMDLTSGERGISGDDKFVGGPAPQIADMYEDIIVQAAANVYRVRILHTRTIDDFDGPTVAKLTARGYHRRPGYHDVMDRIFEPRVNFSDDNQK